MSTLQILLLAWGCIAAGFVLGAFWRGLFEADSRDEITHLRADRERQLRPDDGITIRKGLK